MPIAQGLKELRDSYGSGVQAGRTAAQAAGALARNIRRLTTDDGAGRTGRAEPGTTGQGRSSRRAEAAEPSSGRHGDDQSDDENSDDKHSDDQNKDQQSGRPVKSSHIIEEHVDVGVPIQAAFDQWTDYEKFPQMTKAESAEREREDRVTFKSKIGPSRRTWTSEIVDQQPGRRIAWRSLSGPKTIGVVTFHKLDDRLTRVMVEMEYHPSGAMETIGNFFRMQRRRVRKDLKLFKNFVELNGEVDRHEGERIKGDGLKGETDERISNGSEPASAGRNGSKGRDS